MALPPGFDPTAHRVHDRASRPPEPSNWRRHGPYLRTLAVAIVLAAAAASAGMLMALMGTERSGSVTVRRLHRDGHLRSMMAYQNAIFCI